MKRVYYILVTYRSLKEYFRIINEIGIIILNSSKSFVFFHCAMSFAFTFTKNSFKVTSQ